MKHCPAGFKADAVMLHPSRPGATIKSAVGDLGVNAETLRNWYPGRGRAPSRRPLRRPPTADPAGGDEVAASTQLAGYYTRAIGAEVDRDDLFRACVSGLPRFMVPRHFIELEGLPSTRNGKIDRAKLREMFQEPLVSRG